MDSCLEKLVISQCSGLYSTANIETLLSMVVWRGRGGGGGVVGGGGVIGVVGHTY